MKFNKINTFLILLVFIAFGLTACDNKANEQSSMEQTQGSRASADPLDGDYLVSPVLSEPLTLMPAIASDSVSSQIYGNIYNGLVKLGPDLNIVGDLAESWQISEDQKTITFYLRKDVKWHDGQPFTAHDSVFTYNVMMDPNTLTAYREAFSRMEEVVAIDDYTLKVTYKQPFAKALSSWSFPQLPKHLLEGQDINDPKWGRNPIGTGNYRFNSWEAGQRVILDANNDYFEGRPHIDKLVYKIIPDLSSQLLELYLGNLDVMSLTPDQLEDSLKKEEFNQKFNTYEYPSFSYTYFGFNFKDPKFQDKKVRQALDYAINKEDIVKGVLLNKGQVANGPYLPGTWPYNNNVKPYPYDPEKAKELLAEAGWRDTDNDGILEKDGKKFEITIMTNQGNVIREQCAVLIQGYLAKVGIKASINIIEWSSFLKEYLNKGRFDAIVMGWSITPDPDVYAIFSSTQTNPDELNFLGFKNEQVDKLLDEGRFNLDPEVRKEAYYKLQELLHEEVPCVFLFVPDSLVALSNRFEGPKLAPVGLFYNLNEWYVPADKRLYK